MLKRKTTEEPMERNTQGKWARLQGWTSERFKLWRCKESQKTAKADAISPSTPISPKRLPINADTEDPNWIQPLVEKRVCPCERDWRIMRDTAIWTEDCPTPFPFCSSTHNQKLSDPPMEAAVSWKDSGVQTMDQFTVPDHVINPTVNELHLETNSSSGHFVV